LICQYPDAGKKCSTSSAAPSIEDFRPFKQVQSFLRGTMVRRCTRLPK